MSSSTFDRMIPFTRYPGLSQPSLKAELGVAPSVQYPRRDVSVHRRRRRRQGTGPSLPPTRSPLSAMLLSSEVRSGGARALAPHELTLHEPWLKHGFVSPIVRGLSDETGSMFDAAPALSSSSSSSSSSTSSSSFSSSPRPPWLPHLRPRRPC